MKLRRVFVTFAAVTTPLKPIQFFPIGDVTTVDGEQWTFTLEQLAAIALVLNTTGQEIPVFIQHWDTADPVGWVSNFSVTSEGLFGMVRWIDEYTAEKIRAEKLKYTSPGFFVDDSGAVMSVYEISLTNTPRMQGMRPVEASVNTRSSSPRKATTKRKETRMDLMKIRALLGLAEDASEEDALAALEARLNAAPPDQTAQITAAVQAAVVDIKAATTQLVRAEFEARAAAEAHERKALASVEAAIRTGKVTVAQRAECETFARTSLEAFERFIASAPRVAPISARIQQSFASPDTDFRTADLTDVDTRAALASKATKLVAEGKAKSFTAAIESLTRGGN